MKNYYLILEEKADLGYDEFIDYIDSSSDLIYSEEDIENGKEIEVEVFDSDEGVDFVGRFVFDDDGNYLK